MPKRFGKPTYQTAYRQIRDANTSRKAARVSKSARRVSRSTVSNTRCGYLKLAVRQARFVWSPILVMQVLGARQVRHTQRSSMWTPPSTAVETHVNICKGTTSWKQKNIKTPEDSRLCPVSVTPAKAGPSSRNLQVRRPTEALTCESTPMELSAKRAATNRAAM